MADGDDPLRFTYLDDLDGLTVVRQVSPPGARSFAATYVGPAGWAYDPHGAEGTARLVSQLVTSAAGPYDRVELARRLDRAGAILSRQSAPESSEVTIWGPAAVSETLLEILAMVVRQPRFDRDDVERARRQMAEHQLREATQPANVAERELLHRIFPGGHPYRETGLGSARSLSRIGRDRLVRFHREHFSAEGGLLVVTAPGRSASVVRQVRRRFRHLPSSRAPPPPQSSRRTSVGGGRRIDLPGRSQVEVRLGGPSIAREDPSFPAAFLANELLGGRPLLCRLFQRVREARGLAYHASSDLEAMRWGGYWVAQAGTGADRWRSVVRILEKELELLREKEVPTGELRLIRESVIGETPLSLESTADAHELAVDAAYHHLPEDHWVRWPTVLRALRPRDLHEAAARGFERRGSATVVVGPLGAA